jgi:hypothetical protein
MEFFDRLSLYVKAVGVEHVHVAWDFASAGLDDEQHFELASMLAGGFE